MIYTITGIFSTLLILLSLFFTYKRMKKPKPQNQEQVINQMEYRAQNQEPVINQMQNVGQDAVQNQEEVIDEEPVVTDQQKIDYLRGIYLNKEIHDYLFNIFNDSFDISTNIKSRKNRIDYASRYKSFFNAYKFKPKTSNTEYPPKEGKISFFSMITFKIQDNDILPQFFKIINNKFIYFEYIERIEECSKSFIGFQLTEEEVNQFKNYFPNSIFELTLNKDISISDFFTQTPFKKVN